MRFRLPLLLALLAVYTAGAGGARGQAVAPIDSRVVAAAESLLAERPPGMAGHLEPRVLRAPAVPEGPLRLALLSIETPRGYTPADVLVPDGTGGWRAVGRATLFVARYDSVAVPARPLARGDTLRPGDLAPAWIETTRALTLPLLWADARVLPAGAVARRALPAGEPVRPTDLVAPDAVAVGDPVDVRYSRNGLELTLRGRSRERATLGETLRVYCPDTRATYRVRLVAPGTADWIETL
ncbi:MAG TPA: flagellar basal body P-ring formation chaperone FlgA [Rhodothermales bacterium]|nr:flagellar basal body P-ring formation chaperone FlgA [Rhodothermales bacterium]